jgi:ornithine cyclodeaminase/alanine dehydrogenase-like protein (mu-crystallin family)
VAPATESGVVRLLRKSEVLQCISPEQVVDAVREALVATARGDVVAPAPMSFDFRGARGEAHVKGAYVDGSPDWTVKVATGFYDNPQRGLPTASGLSFVSSAETGQLEAIVLDGGYLTDVRTAAAGCLAAGALAPAHVEQVGIIGCGIQARVQLEYLLLQRTPERIVAYGRNAERARAYADEMESRFGIAVTVAASAREAVDGSQLVLTVTPSEAALVESAWVGDSLAIVAVGSDMPGKQELDPEILERADLVVADDPGQAARVGELQHAPGAAGRAGKLGELLAERSAEPPTGLCVADLTGLGAEDAAVAGVVARRARELGLGEALELD